MTAQQLEQIVHLKPFKPYRLVLVDGEEILVDRPRKSHVSGSVVSMVGKVKRNGGATVERLRIVQIERVVSAEHVELPIRGR